MNRLVKIQLIAGVLATVAAVALLGCYFEITPKVSQSSNEMFEAICYYWQASTFFKLWLTTIVISVCVCAPVGGTVVVGMFFETFLLWALFLDKPGDFSVTFLFMGTELALILFSLVMLAIQALLYAGKEVSHQ